MIEVMGLFILPGRLLTELDGLKDYLTGVRPIDDAPAPDSPLEKHYSWIRDIAARKGVSHTTQDADAILREELGSKCAKVLTDAGVYKQSPEGVAGLMRFLQSLKYSRRA